ncbi:MAG: tyrosine-protein phosphatase [Clostridia bacterium]|nr:tyrosine-protein phosphatase [Clostridia bacterium]
MEKTTFQNFRDMGGLTCPEGMRIRKWKLFRAPAIAPRTDADWNFLEDLGLETIIDFRTDAEIREKQDRLPSSCDYVHAEVFPAEQYPYLLETRKARLRVLTLRGRRISKLKQNKLNSYREMPFSEAYQAVFSAMDGGKTIAFHCSEGKDRTGICAAILEYAFGRSEEQILEEYLRSNELRPGKPYRILKTLGFPEDLREDISYCTTVHKELLLMAKSEILARYGSLDGYLRSGLGITPERVERWKTFYLEPAGEDGKTAQDEGK